MLFVVEMSQLKKIYSFVLLILVAIACQTEDNQKVQIVQMEEANPWTNLNWNNKSENFQFVIVTDRTGGERPGVFQQGLEKVNLLQPEFVMSVGDLIQGYTEDLEELNRQWDEFDNLVGQLEMPFFYVPGNHDITNKMMEELWMERYGRTYYHFVYQDVLFLCLNSEEPILEEGATEEVYHTSDFYLSDKQREYVKQTLEENKDVRWTFVFWHKPVWLYAESDNPMHQQLIPKSGWPEIEQLLQSRKHTVFAGHIHRYVHKEKNNSDYITLATTGGGSALRGPVFGQFDHVLWVTMTDDGPVMANLLLEGIFDEDFSKEDIEKHLALSMQNKVMRVNSEFELQHVTNKEILKFTLFNHFDDPVKSTVELSNSDHITYSKNQLIDSIPPNSAVSLEVAISIKAAADSTAMEQLINEVNNQYGRWSLEYDFEEYGQIQIKGSTRLLR